MLSTKHCMRGSRIRTATQILSLVVRRRRKNSRKLLQSLLLIKHKVLLGNSNSSSLCKGRINSSNLFLLKIGSKMLANTSRTSSNSLFLLRTISSRGRAIISSKIIRCRLLSTIIGLTHSQERRAIKAKTISNSNMLSLAKRRGTARGRSRMGS